MQRLFLLVVLTAGGIYPWGLKGHRIVARIAENHLTENARTKVKEILADQPLTKVANEADGYRSHPQWKCAAPFHYVSIEDKDNYLASEKNAQGDIVRAIFYFEDVLRDKRSPPAMKATALKWLVHLVGDIHQPLHVGRACDRGGNSVEVRWFKAKSNLHKVWDSQFINQEELSFTEYAELLGKADEKTLAQWQASTYLDWAGEAAPMRAQIYSCMAQDGCKAAATGFGSCAANASEVRAELEYAYVEKNRELLNRQLLKAGIRLAAVLNRIFADSPFSHEEMKARRDVDALKTEDPNQVEECVTKAVR